ncbi:alkaline shock response membrane anchor protein AmaP [Arthrobacter sp. NicSoilB8]|uniref:alkaline shock response membrane anchor protein AmaP n=1 Tax=Arthrobacter sp. NicSoilB8 TaxID=2830998 RepID=UPI001CC44C03|nr:alkaline shock response membrane anchor protein AmaP [Arthrobacter sp. NicSoilB8]BCW71279.1 hypothetical protein NicSoilB8_23230 [Arthrobacter sp. NicSoilB8]
MPWWSWILIWIALVSLSLLFYVLLGVRLFRKFTTTLGELSEAADRFSRLPSPVFADAAAGPAGSATGAEDGADGAPRPTPGDAVFASPARMRHDYHASKFSRQNARRLRRIQRKKSRGQPQALRDIELG